MNKISREDSLSKASKTLLLKEPFYGMFLIMLHKIWDKRVPTAGVGLNGINYQLVINEGFWNSLNEKQHVQLTKHELLHIGFFHITEFSHLTDRELSNIAQDLEINQYLIRDEMPPGGLHIEQFPELNLEPKQGCVYYYDKLQQGKKDGNCPNLNAMLKAIADGEGECTISIPGDGTDTIKIPQHDWEEFEKLDEATQRLIQKQTEHILKELAEQTKKSCGNIPGEFKDILDRINTVEPPKFDWKGYLRRYVGSTGKTFTKLTRRKSSKYIEGNPGLRVLCHKHILLALDTSGSVSKSELKEFLGEMNHIYKTKCKITVIQADTAISNIAVFNPKIDYSIFGRGGTDFTPACDYYNKHYKQFSCMIYMTDGEASAPQNPMKGKILWVLSSASAECTHLPGHTIKLN